MEQQIFFQSSLPRSGSTLLQNILAQRNDMYATPTSGVLELLYGARANFSTSPEFKAQDVPLMEAGFKEFCNKGMFGFYNQITDKKFILDKSRGWGVYRPFLNEGNHPGLCKHLIRLVQEEKNQIDSLKILIANYGARTQAVIAKLWSE